MATFDLRQLRQEEVATVDHAPQVHVDNPLPIVEARLRKHRLMTDAGVVDEYMHGTVRCPNLAGEFPHAGLVADIRDVRGRDLITTGCVERKVEACETVLVQIDEREVAAFVLNWRMPFSTTRSVGRSVCQVLSRK